MRGSVVIDGLRSCTLYSVFPSSPPLCLPRLPAPPFLCRTWPGCRSTQGRGGQRILIRNFSLINNRNNNNSKIPTTIALTSPSMPLNISSFSITLLTPPSKTTSPIIPSWTFPLLLPHRRDNGKSQRRCPPPPRPPSPCHHHHHPQRPLPGASFRKILKAWTEASRNPRDPEYFLGIPITVSVCIKSQNAPMHSFISLALGHIS